MAVQGTNEAAHDHLEGDGPKISIADDEYGLAAPAKAVAELLCNRIRSSSYVLGIEGSWGSGKTTFLNFMIEESRKLAPNHVLIEFQPWLVGNQSAILPLFFAQLAKEIEKIEIADLKWHQRFFRSWRRSLSDKLKRYGSHAGVLAVPVGALAPFEPATAAVLAGGLRLIEKLKGYIFREKSPQELKAEIALSLGRLGVSKPELRFVVIIDDTDRLEPNEASEVLRLVRQVGDFPLIRYVVCFDREILARQVRVALRLPSGKDYLEKIFQTTVSVPPQEPFALRRAVKRRLADVINSYEAGDRLDSLRQYRLHLAIDVWCGRLLSGPRDVSRLIDAVNSGFRHLPEGSDAADFIWLQVIKLKAPELYSWVRNYVSNIGAYRDGGSVTESEAKQEGKKLAEQMRSLGWSVKSYDSGIGEFLPGIGPAFLDEENKRKVFNFQKHDLKIFERDRRLGSPIHWRHYFAFESPSYAVKDGEVAQFRDLLRSDPAKASRILLEMAQRPHERKTHFALMMLDRVFDQKESLDQVELDGLVQVFSASLDELAMKADDFNLSGRSELWFEALRLMSIEMSGSFFDALAKGDATNWMASALRDQAFAHGIGGSNTSDRPKWLTEDQTRKSIERLLARFRKMGMEVFSKPSPLDMLFLWHQAGPENECREFVAEHSKRDEDFVIVLDSMRGWANSSQSGISHPLYRRYVDIFMDPDNAQERLTKLSESGSNNVRKRALRLLQVWVDKDF